jgi:hypothetical protein
MLALQVPSPARPAPLVEPRVLGVPFLALLLSCPSGRPQLLPSLYQFLNCAGARHFTVLRPASQVRTEVEVAYRAVRLIVESRCRSAASSSEVRVSGGTPLQSILFSSLRLFFAAADDCVGSGTLLESVRLIQTKFLKDSR